MGRRRSALLLVFLLAAMPLNGLSERMEGERVTVDAGFPGDWYVFEEFQFGLKLPKGWRPVPGKDEVYFMAVDETGRCALWLELYHTEGNTMDTVLEDLSALPEFQDVKGMYFNGVPFVRYTAEGLLGYATMAADETILLFIKLMPSPDAELAALATRIMATVSPLSKLPKSEITGGEGK